MNIKTIIVFLITAMALVSCGDSKPVRNGAARAAPEVKKGIVPVADNEIAVIEMENSAAYGTIKIELYSNIAPKMVARFKELAKEGFYDGTSFHRVNQSVIQGGDPNSKDDDPTNEGAGESTKPDLPAEFSDVPYVTGIVGAARLPDPNSANSQFFITLSRTPNFDKEYTVFGKVVDGMNKAHTISGVQPKIKERPVEDVRIKSITIQPKN